MRYENRRQYLRLKVYHLVKYRWMSEDKQQAAPTIATLRDIGAGGACLKTDEAIPLSTLLELRINFPNVTTTVFALAKVVWVKKIKKSNFYYIGAQFVEIGDSVRMIIDEQVKRVYQKLKT